MGGWMGWKVVDSAFECVILRSAYSILILAVLLVCVRVATSAYQRQTSARYLPPLDAKSTLHSVQHYVEASCLGSIL